MKKATVLFLSLLISGCATSPVSNDEAKNVPQNRIFYSGTGSSKIVIIRDKGWMAGGGCYVMATMDGKEAARLDTAEKVELKVIPGRHIIGLIGDRYGKALCGLTSGASKETSTVINSGETQFYRITGDTNSGLDIRPTTIY
ncbi:hypothetical protein G5574_06105 [Pantoea stewartii]|uniref:hypothetical protein n=1 Tax=Pantoea stewartii TaxID=66269 RepID=UPI0013DDF810|nr:hypothetical protein [Pantoea stewartii]QIE96559.1 hypothetical protein G5574_06105 [Pantoea stewartii]